MSGRSYSQSSSLLYVLGLCGLILMAGCQKSESAPTVGSTPKAGTQDTSSDTSSSNDKSRDSSSSNKDRDDEDDKKSENMEPNEPNNPSQDGPLPEAKQMELKTLFTGEWNSDCIKFEDPDAPGQMFSATETWKLLPDGNIEVTYHDFDDGNCKTPSPGYESYVFAIAKPVAVKEVGSQHFYVEMNVIKELNEQGKLADANDTFLIMVKFEGSGMMVDFTEDTSATTFSADAMKFTKK